MAPPTKTKKIRDVIKTRIQLYRQSRSHNLPTRLFPSLSSRTYPQSVERRTTSSRINSPIIICQCLYPSINSDWNKTWSCWSNHERHHTHHIGDRTTIGRPGRSWFKPNNCYKSHSHSSGTGQWYIRWSTPNLWNVAIIDEALKHQIIEIIEDNFIVELRTKCTGFMGVKAIDLIHHIMNRYVKVT